MSEWIRVLDRKPAEHTDVIVWSRGNEPACAYLRHNEWRASGVESDCGIYLDGEPSHWHEIPELPQ